MYMYIINIRWFCTSTCRYFTVHHFNENVHVCKSAYICMTYVHVIDYTQVHVYKIIL